MYHLVYLTRNLINNKIYVGVHSTYDIGDGYLGSGNALRYAIKKYGKENFERTILHYCYDTDQMYEWERHIVNEDFVVRIDTYNICLGGKGGVILSFEKSSERAKKGITTKILNGYDFHHTSETRTKMKNNHRESNSEITRTKISKANLGRTNSKEQNLKISEYNKLHPSLSMLNKHHTKETKIIISQKKSTILFKATTPTNKEIIFYNLTNFCKQYNLSEITIRRYMNISISIDLFFNYNKNQLTTKTLNCINWKIERLNAIH